jgi:hypothetical protein
MQAMGLPLSLLSVRKIATGLLKINLFGPTNTAYAHVGSAEKQENEAIELDEDDEEPEDITANDANDRPADEVLLTCG